MLSSAHIAISLSPTDRHHTQQPNGWYWSIVLTVVGSEQSRMYRSYVAEWIAAGRGQQSQGQRIAAMALSSLRHKRYVGVVYCRNRRLLLLPLLIAALLSPAHSLSMSLSSPKSPTNKVASVRPVFSRREAIVAGATATLATASSMVTTTAAADAADSPAVSSIPLEGPPERQALLRAIIADEPEEVVKNLIAKLENLDPSGGNGAVKKELEGSWKLIYSVNAEAFSPLLKLPRPIRPTSIQLLGEDAQREVGAGRVANALNFPNIPLSFLLSSGAVPIKNDPKALEIFPPFRFEVVWGDNSLRRAGSSKGEGKEGQRLQIVDAGSDKEFRALNVRDEAAQSAGRNIYEQKYLETSGKPGDLRISEVVDGDPVIVGAIFIHQRM